MSLYRINTWLTDRITISRRIQTQDNFGGYSEGFEDILFDIRARLWPVSGLRERSFAGETFLPTMKMIVAPDTKISIGDRIKYDDGVYMVIQAFTRKDKLVTQHIEILLSKVDL